MPNAYVKAPTESDIDIFFYVPQGMIVEKEELQRLGVHQVEEVVLQLQRSLCGLSRQDGFRQNYCIRNRSIEVGICAMCQGHVSLLQS